MRPLNLERQAKQVKQFQHNQNAARVLKLLPNFNWLSRWKKNLTHEQSLKLYCTRSICRGTCLETE